MSKKSVEKGVSHLSHVLKSLNVQPRLAVSNQLKALTITWSPKLCSKTADHFVKHELPRIRWANPELTIQCQRQTEKVDPIIKLEFAGGKTETMNIKGSITEQFMDRVGTPSWQAYKAERVATGLPVLLRKERVVEVERTISPLKLEKKEKKRLGLERKMMEEKKRKEVPPPVLKLEGTTANAYT